MGKYELTLVLSGKASSAKEKSVNDVIEKMVKILKGKIEKMDKWGKIELAYKIEKETDGNFLHYALELPASAAAEIGKKLKMESDIIRHLLIKRE